MDLLVFQGVLETFRRGRETGLNWESGVKQISLCLDSFIGAYSSKLASLSSS